MHKQIPSVCELSGDFAHTVGKTKAITLLKLKMSDWVLRQTTLL